MRIRPKWNIVRYALDAARVSIFALDTTGADYHDLEYGLSRAANETGGSTRRHTESCEQLRIDCDLLAPLDGSHFPLLEARGGLGLGSEHRKRNRNETNHNDANSRVSAQSDLRTVLVIV